TGPTSRRRACTRATRGVALQIFRRTRRRERLLLAHLDARFGPFELDRMHRTSAGLVRVRRWSEKFYRRAILFKHALGGKEAPYMPLQQRIADWPLIRQFREGDPLGLGKAAQSERSRTLRPRIDDADHTVRSICPYCAVGCAQLVYVKDGEVTQIEGDPASPISRGRLCPKGAASKNLHDGSRREYKVKYR